MFPINDVASVWKLYTCIYGFFSVILVVHVHVYVYNYVFIQHMEWRKEWDVDNILKWTPPEVFLTCFPGGFSGYGYL